MRRPSLKNLGWMRSESDSRYLLAWNCSHASKLKYTLNLNPLIPLCVIIDYEGLRSETRHLLLTCF